MTRMPDYQSLMHPVLEIAAKGETSVPLTEADIATRFGLSDAEREELLPSGKQRVLHNRIHWAKFYLTKAGFLESPTFQVGSRWRVGNPELFERGRAGEAAVARRRPSRRGRCIC
jgi:restriction endonuclease Mrr